MPEGIPPKPDPKDFEPPVAWLFGRQLIANLKWILLYTAFKGKLDARDWMKANIIPHARSSNEIEEFWRGSHEDSRAEGNGLHESEEEFWFDYIADSGDGQRAVYSIAYLCMSDLAVKKEPQLGEKVEFILRPDGAKLEAVTMLLPRGAFLFVGGDTSYHIADYANLADRLQNPFCWAARDLFKKNAESVMSSRYRLLLGIPGNHDYYDALDGFNRQFRRPSAGEGMPEGWRQPQLALPTFRRIQEASYLALRLPFDWWFWGMDTEEGEIDYRQEEFFRYIQAEYVPTRLIVATPEPTTVFGKYAGEDESQSKTFAALGLERPFLKNPEPMGEGKCRLDLSGDVHHYARHWGLPAGADGASNYASVMSGGGGAFFHPSHTTIKELKPEVIYPLPKDSRREVADQLFKIRNIFKGGYVWLAGFIIAFSLFFAASFPQSSRDAIDSFPLFIKLGISSGLSPQSPLPPTVKQMPRNPWWTNSQPAPTGYWMAMFSIVLSLILLGAALYYSSRLFKKEYDPTWKHKKREVTEGQRIILWTIVFLSFLSLAFGILGFHAPQSEEVLTRFGHSLIIFAALAWSVLAVIESVWYSEWLFEEVYYGNLKPWHYWPVWVLNIMSLLGFGSSLWFFGRQESSFLISDIGLVIVLLLVGGGLVFFAYSTGGNLKKGAGKFAFLLLGASHALVQLFVPFLLVRKGNLLLAPLAALILVLIFKYIGRALAKSENGWPLAIAWIVFSALLLVTPFVMDVTTPPNIPGIIPHIFNDGLINVGDNHLTQFLLCFYAGAIGAFMSCVLFGWYLAVALAFNGHNNEAGGAARIEGFKEFIRFRLTPKGLTGYVIGMDEPSTDGEKLQPKIVDIFRISNL
ncbi:MAG: hypothetical protein AUG51_14190 [Acidobacteria bacterium 13_1_20CM_3_53_8]|nr:MAG: hypothetical protein AUG51_14190 [Acidobacteria bacterium 13_1_20CM_3_53_8]